jgi:hypothetical protein
MMSFSTHDEITLHIAHAHATILHSSSGEIQFSMGTMSVFFGSEYV